MKKAQKWILDNILIHLDVDKAAMAFQKGEEVKKSNTLEDLPPHLEEIPF